MQQQQQTEPDSRVTFLGALAFVSRTFATSIEVFLHRRFGERYFGLHSAAVILAVLIYSTFWEGYDVTPLLGFLGFYFVACLGARAGIAKRRLTGDVEHSYYNGRPILLSFWPFKKAKERTVKGLEPFLVFLTGAFVMPLSEPLGGYLMVASLGLLVSLGLAASYQRQRDLDLQDALIDQQNAAQRLRESGWRR